MATVLIPLDAETPDYTEQVTLDGTVYTLRFRWSVREESWYMDVLTAVEEPIRLGIKVVPYWSLGRNVPDPRFPPGVFSVWDTGGTDEAPGEHDLGGRVIILYTEAS